MRHDSPFLNNIIKSQTQIIYLKKKTNDDQIIIFIKLLLYLRICIIITILNE